MEPGTGKTRIALQLIYNRLLKGKINNVIWLCPCSVKEDMQFNISGHISDASIIHIYGIESLSQSDRLYFKLLDMAAKTKSYLVVDESDLAKNHFAKRTRRIERLAELCPYRIILNGTPVSKSEADLFAQWYILDKRILGYNSFWSFAANHIEYDEYGRPRRCLNVDYLSRKIEPYTYTVTKKECLALPEKRYMQRSFSLTQEQAQHYEETKDMLLSNVDEFDSTTIYKLFTGLQLICSGKHVLRINPLISKPFFDNPHDNPRIQTLLEVLNSFENEKVIVWCKYKHEIDEIKQVLTQAFSPEVITEFHGGIGLKSRYKQLERFRDTANFLLANKTCGGYGLNLQFCNNSVYYSNDFNWATRSQSEDRIHRIGQDKEVNLFDICARSKIDTRILKNLWRKESLSDSFKDELRNGRGLSKWIDGIEEKGYDTDRIEQTGETVCT
ncbi:SNF2 domain-containing protein [Anaerobacterium chartisolvens]|uniref:SNF2 domain-containing protein n=1 Tax=Anaerobacterium chartisolvens TaxID=1297424 RepID=A0A369BH21_9FIRM|nr:DEAD/DEAH box helicase [Anaerobacterium chartisolvens]RCX20852.1 SNF2 domain-containing protein [Anaerobacterium chartisolvens]